MNPDQENKLLATLYDRLYDIITYCPDGKSSLFNSKTTFLQFAKNMALRDQDFANAISPSNPNGLANTAEAFSRLIDPVPAVQGDYVPTASSIDTNYGTIVNGANATETPDPAAVNKYMQAYNYLYTTTQITDFEGNKQSITAPSPRYTNYMQNQTSYFAALSAYRTAFNNYDLTKVQDQRQWQANAPALEANLNNAWSTFRSGDAAYIEQALAVLDTSVNSAVRAVLENARKTYSTSSLPSNIPGTPNWHLSYALPSNWCIPAATKSFSHLVINSGSLNKTASAQYSTYGAGASWSAGLWSVGSGVSGSSGETHYHMDSSNFQLALDLGVIQVRRPWMDGSIFSMGGWSMGDAYKPNSISTGDLSTNAGKMMPMITTGIVVARNVQIKCDFNTEDQSHIESAVSGSTSVGWGPFSVSGHYSHSSSKDTFNSTYANGTLTIPGIQVVGFINWIVPACPPQTASSIKAASTAIPPQKAKAKL